MASADAAWTKHPITDLAPYKAYDPGKDYRIYSDQALDYNPDTKPEGHILWRSDYQRDVGADIVQGKYFQAWSDVEYGV